MYDEQSMEVDQALDDLSGVSPRDVFTQRAILLYLILDWSLLKEQKSLMILFINLKELLLLHSVAQIQPKP